MSRLPVLLIFLSTLTASCRLFGPESVDEFSDAILMPSCGPTDGPALAIYLAERGVGLSCSRLPRFSSGEPPPESFMSIHVLGIDRPEEGAFELGTYGPSYSEGGWARRCEAGATCVEGNVGTVILGKTDANGRVPVSVDLQFEDGSRVSNHYTAIICERQYFCG